MEYLLSVKEDRRGKALINHLRSLDFVELNQSEPEIDVAEFKKMIKKAERSKSMTLDEVKKRVAEWAKKKNS